MKFGSLFSGIGGFDLGCEIPLVETNYAGPELPLWEGATLCSECYAAEIANTQRPNALTLRELQKSIAWYD